MRWYVAGLALWLGLVFWPSPCFAATLTLVETVRFAMSHNAAIAQRQAAVAQAEATYTRQRAAEYPSVVGSLQNVLEKQNNFGGTLAQYGVTPIPNFSQNTAQIGSQWTLYNGSYNQIVTQEDRRKVEQARADLRDSQSQTTQRIVAMFFAIANRRNLYGLAQANLIYQQALLDVAQANERAGMVAGVDVLRAQVGLQETQIALLSTQSDEASATESLAAEIGASIDTTFAMPAVLPAPPLPAGTLSALVALAQRSRPDVAAAAAQVAVAKLSGATIDTDLLPQVSVYAAFGNQTSPTGFVDEQQQLSLLNQECARYPNQIQCIGYPFANVVRGMPGFWDIGATSTFSLPIIDYGTRAAAHRSANDELRAAELALVAAQTSAQADVVESLRAAQTARATMSYHRKAVDLGTEAARIAKLQYSNGLISLTDTKAAQQTSLQTQADLFDAQIAYINAVVRLRSALGTFDPISMVADL